MDIRKRSSIRLAREPELPIVPFESQSSKTLGEGRGNAFIVFLKRGRKEIAVEAGNSGGNSGTSEENIPEDQARKLGSDFIFSTTRCIGRISWIILLACSGEQMDKWSGRSEL